MAIIGLNYSQTLFIKSVHGPLVRQGGEVAPRIIKNSLIMHEFIMTPSETQMMQATSTPRVHTTMQLPSDLLGH